MFKRDSVSVAFRSETLSQVLFQGFSALPIFANFPLRPGRRDVL
jgi:hypothetical protein